MPEEGSSEVKENGEQSVESVEEAQVRYKSEDDDEPEGKERDRYANRRGSMDIAMRSYIEDETSHISLRSGVKKRKKGHPNFNNQKATSSERAFYVSIMAEFLGTLMLVFLITSTVVFSGLDSDVFVSISSRPVMSVSRHFLISLSGGMSYTVLIYCVMGISDAHLNPAVTVARIATNRFPWGQGALYVGAQLLGGIFGAGITRMCLPRIPDVYSHFGGAMNVVLGGQWLESGAAFGVEVLCTLVYVFIYFSAMELNMDPHSRSHKGPLAPLAVGLAVFVGHLIAVPVTLCSLNPARSIAAAVMMGSTKDLFVFILAPTLGALIGGFTYEYAISNSLKVEGNAGVEWTPQNTMMTSEHDNLGI